MAGLVLLAGLLGLMIFSGPGTDAETPDGPRIFINLLSGDPLEQKAALDSLSKNWSAAHIPKLVEVARFSDSRTRAEVFRLLRNKTRQTIEDDFDAWLHWTWNEAPAYEIEDYSAFKAALYAGIDRRFARYFAQAQESKPRIRLDEIAWGGVLQDGIPPLREPEMISAKEAGYLADDNVVFNKGHTLHAASRSAHAANITFVKTNRHALFGCDEDVTFPVGDFCINHFVIEIGRESNNS